MREIVDCAVYLGVEHYGMKGIDLKHIDEFRYRFRVAGEDRNTAGTGGTGDAAGTGGTGDAAGTGGTGDAAGTGGTGDAAGTGGTGDSAGTGDTSGTNGTGDDAGAGEGESLMAAEGKSCPAAPGRERIFLIDGGEADGRGKRRYPVQNTLKEGYAYSLELQDGIIRRVTELPSEPITYTPPVAGIPGLRTIKNVLRTALEPVGTTLYIYGGGWSWQDAHASIQVRTIGVSPDWIRFFRSQDASFTYRDRDGDPANMDPPHSFYPYGEYNEYYYAGLDCSGYLGWVLYNVLHTENGEKGFITGSTRFAKSLADQGFGTWQHDVGCPAADPADPIKPGDIMSIDGHVWMALGACRDGSVVILHSTPSVGRGGQPGGGVQIGAIGTDGECEACKLADSYMSRYYPEWYSRYPVALKSPDDYFTYRNEAAGRFRWDAAHSAHGFTDPEGMQAMDAARVLEELFIAP